MRQQSDEIDWLVNSTADWLLSIRFRRECRVVGLHAFVRAWSAHVV
jgi:hypothetical protein